MGEVKRSTYNRLYYKWRREYEKNHKGSYEVNRLERNRREYAQKKYARNIEKYAEEQKIIRTVRKARGWSQKQLGEMLGVSLQYVCHWEKGRAPAPWDRLYEIMPELKEARE